MSTLGKVLLCITLLALVLVVAPIPYCGWGARLLVIHNQWATKLREGQKKNLDDIEANNKARLELQQAEAELARLQLGWERVWEIDAAGGNNVGINVLDNGGRIVVNGIGSENGLRVRRVDDGAGQSKVVAPVVHVFRAMPEAGYTYVGEYVADPNQIGTNSAVLFPTRTPTPGEPQPWLQSQGAWRLRTMIPTAPRSSMDELHRRITRVFDYYRETVANIQQQQANLEAARAQLDIRKRELLGNPDAVAIEGRPEFTDGLLKAIDDQETLRNERQLEIDSLRRSIRQLSDQRDQLVQELNELASELPAGTSYDDSPLASGRSGGLQ